MRTVLTIPLLALLLSPALLTQETRPSFEAATIKPWSPSPPANAPQKPAKVAPIGAPAPITDRVHFIGQIELLIESAYGFQFSSGRILSGPDWMHSESDRYELIAKIDDVQFAAMRTMTPPEQQHRVALMEQSLLADRLKFRAHLETRELPGYALVVSKNGSKLQPAKESDITQMALLRNGADYELKATAVSAEELARSPFLRMENRQIADKTGLQGKFTFTLKFRNTAIGAAAEDSNAPELPTALQEQLGLRLVPETRSAEILVIDHIERPSEN